MNHLKIFVVALFCLAVVCANAKEYHVSVNGDDSNKGTASSPFKTISRASLVAQPGDVITVHAGTYRESIAPPRGGKSNEERITYQAAEGEEVIIKGSEVIKGWEIVEGTVWKVVLDESYFGDFNPYVDTLVGDWLFTKGKLYHTGEVYLNNRSFYEAQTLEDVKNPKPFKEEYAPVIKQPEEYQLYQWYTESENGETTIWANFQGENPNEALVEINVHQTCFYPRKTGVNYITVKGFTMSQAATNWAPPTAEQVGLIGTHWSKGWIIEDNTISHSKSVGITLGKDRASGHNEAIKKPSVDGSIIYIETIFKAASESGWSKENIGSHLVRNNTIHNCEQAGIVGSLGAVFSTITQNHIYDIWLKRQYYGPELGAIKIHGAIGMEVSHNHLHNAYRGIWLDWMAQDTRVTGNLCYDNSEDDLMMEVSHGPFLIDNNIFLSEFSIFDWSQGGAYVHNLFGGKIMIRHDNRFTPYMKTYSTQIMGISDNQGGDNKFFNNIFLSGESKATTRPKLQLHTFYGLGGYYGRAHWENTAVGNVYYGKSLPGVYDKNFEIIPDYNPSISVEEKDGVVFLSIEMDKMASGKTSLITGKDLGTSFTTGAPYVEKDGTPYLFESDYLGLKREEQTIAGPLKSLKVGANRFQVWPK